MRVSGTEAAAALRRAGIGPGDPIGLAVRPNVGVGLATTQGIWSVVPERHDPFAVVRLVAAELRPRWVVWSVATATDLLAAGLRVATCWDVAAVHRVLFGGWRADPARVWAQIHELPLSQLPRVGPADLFGQGLPDERDAEEPVGVDGYLRPEWVSGGWSATLDRMGRWAEVAVQVAVLQDRRLTELRHRPRAVATARVESTVELLCAELSADGLPMNRQVAEDFLARVVGPPSSSPADADAGRAARDAAVLSHAPAGVEVDLRSPAQVRVLLGRVGVEVPDTRAWRLRGMVDVHPLVPALLAWRRAERIATTYGYSWLDAHLGSDGRLRGVWTGSDGAAGRMTASAGLHNMPTEMRAAVVAEPGQVFVRADLGQIEPRVLAAVSGDAALARASRADDMYAPVAAQLKVDRATAKVAVLGAMYGQTTGHGAQALRRLRDAYPVAVAYLEDADRAARAGRDLRTYGGRRIPMGTSDPTVTGRAGPAPPGTPGSEVTAVALAGARGRYGRNAVVQGAAAELFKMWAVIVRARGGGLGARIVLCLHDELLVQVAAQHGSAVARLLDDCLGDATRRWAPDDSVHFIADITVVDRWSEAK